MAQYRGATERELKEAGGLDRLMASLMPGRLLPHAGEIRLTGDSLVLEGWMTIPRQEIARISLDFDENYSRWQAGGIGPEGPLLGLFQSGKPVIITLRDGTVCYLTIDRQALTGTTQNQAWFQRLQSWAQGQ